MKLNVEVRALMAAAFGQVMPLDGSTKQRIEVESRAVMSILRPEDPTDWGRTVGTLLIMVVWGAIYVGTTFSGYGFPEYFPILTAIIFLIFGRWWGINVAEIAGVRSGGGGGQKSDDED